jgi:hypothetical protein
MSSRLRRTGIAIIVAGLLAAAWLYWSGTRAAVASEEDILDGYAKQMNREMRIQMGTFGIVMMQWTNALKRPGTQAILVGAGSLAAGWICFHLARQHDAGSSA